MSVLGWGTGLLDFQGHGADHSYGGPCMQDTVLGCALAAMKRLSDEAAYQVRVEIALGTYQVIGQMVRVEEDPVHLGGGEKS